MILIGGQLKKNNEIDELLEGEYPPKYVGMKGNGESQMVYRIDGEMGLTFYQEKGHRASGYRWEHFYEIKLSKHGKHVNRSLS